MPHTLKLWMHTAAAFALAYATAYLHAKAIADWSLWLNIAVVAVVGLHSLARWAKHIGPPP